MIFNIFNKSVIFHSKFANDIVNMLFMVQNDNKDDGCEKCYIEISYTMNK